MKSGAGGGGGRGGDGGGNGNRGWDGGSLQFMQQHGTCDTNVRNCACQDTD